MESEGPTTETEAQNDDQKDQEKTETPAGEAPLLPGKARFGDMVLDSGVVQALADMGFVEPMEVQTAVYPPAAEGRDLMVQSKTGSGKTAAFGIPIVERITVGDHFVQALVLCPTRELALQVASECEKIAAHSKHVEVVAVYGGAPMGRQIEALRAGAQLVVGTPGRLMDHLRRGTLKLDRVRILVLDEADEMLSMGFLEDILTILAALPKERQTLLFSATVPEEIQRIASRHMRDPQKIVLSGDFIGVEEIQHIYYLVSGI